MTKHAPGMQSNMQAAEAAAGTTRPHTKRSYYKVQGYTCFNGSKADTGPLASSSYEGDQPSYVDKAGHLPIPTARPTPQRTPTYEQQPAMYPYIPTDLVLH
jgi:hypothetical protein